MPTAQTTAEAMFICFLFIDLMSRTIARVRNAAFIVLRQREQRRYLYFGFKLHRLASNILGFIVDLVLAVCCVRVWLNHCKVSSAKAQEGSIGSAGLEDDMSFGIDVRRQNFRVL